MSILQLAVHSVGLSASRSRESDDGSERVDGQHHSRYSFISSLMFRLIKADSFFLHSSSQRGFRCSDLNLVLCIGFSHGNRVVQAGVILERTLSRLPNQRCWWIGEMKPELSLEDALEFSRGYDSELSVGINDCRHHTLGEELLNLLS